MRLIIYVTVVIAFILAGSLFHDTYSKLNVAKGSAEKCTQLQESLSAQLQVVYEHKTRLEKTLQQEKSDHKHTQEEFQAYKSEAEASLDKGKQEANNKYTSLKQQYEMLQNQHTDLQTEFKHLQQEHTKNLDEKQNLLAQTNLELAKVREEKDAEIIRLKEQLTSANDHNVELQMSNDNIVARLKNAEQQFSQVVSEIQYLRYKYQEAQNDNQDSKKIIDQLNKKLNENKMAANQLGKLNLNQFHNENDAGGQLQKRQAGEEIVERSDSPKYVSQEGLQPAEFNTKAPENMNFLDIMRKQFPQQNSREIHEQFDHAKTLKDDQFADANRINPHFPFNRQMGGQKLYFPNQDHPLERRVNQGYPKHFAAQPHEFSHQDQQFNRVLPNAWNKRNNLSVQQGMPAEHDRFKDRNVLEPSFGIKDVGPMPHMKKNYLSAKKKGADFKEAHKQVPRPHIIEKDVKRRPVVIETEKPNENIVQMDKPDLNQEQLENVDQDQSEDNDKAENQDQVAKPLINQHNNGAIPNIAAPQLAENDEETLLNPARKDEQQDFDDIGNGDTQEKEEYKDQEIEKNVDEKDDNKIKRDM